MAKALATAQAVEDGAAAVAAEFPGLGLETGRKIARLVLDATEPRPAGARAAHVIITPECRLNRGDEGAWGEAVVRARAQYDAIVDGWRESQVQPTLHLVLGIERPFVPAGEWAEVRVCEHGKPVIGPPCPECQAREASIPGRGQPE